MALEGKDLGADTNVFPESSVRIVAKDNKAVKLEIVAGAPVYELGHPLQESIVLGTYESWVTGNEIVGFVHPLRHQTSATGETLVVVMIAGDIHRDAVQLPAGQTQPNLDLALQTAALGSRGIRVFGLADVSL